MAVSAVANPFELEVGCDMCHDTSFPYTYTRLIDLAFSKFISHQFVP